MSAGLEALAGLLLEKLDDHWRGVLIVVVGALIATSAVGSLWIASLHDTIVQTRYLHEERLVQAGEMRARDQETVRRIARTLEPRVERARDAARAATELLDADHDDATAHVGAPSSPADTVSGAARMTVALGLVRPIVIDLDAAVDDLQELAYFGSYASPASAPPTPWMSILKRVVKWGLLAALGTSLLAALVASTPSGGAWIARRRRAVTQHAETA